VHATHTPFSCGFKSYFVSVREDYKLRIFGNKVLKRIFGPERDKETERERGRERQRNCKLKKSIIYTIHRRASIKNPSKSALSGIWSN